MREAIGREETARLLRQWDHILVLSHRNPDGDTLGSAAALLRGLAAMGKRVSFACADPTPEKFSGLFEGLALEEFAPEHVVTVDVADAALLGTLQNKYEGRVDLAIDHHGSHRPFAKAFWVEGDSAAAAEMIWLLLTQELGAAPTREMAEAVYTGVCTDTGCFRYQNTTPRSHRIAAACMELGVDAAAINRLHFETKSLARVAAERRALESLELFGGGRCAMIRLPLAVYEETGAAESELDGVAALPREIEGVLIGVTVKERQDGEIKVSLRCDPPANAAELCRQFGGGGHSGAAGCSFQGLSLAEAAARMKAACEEYLDKI